MIWKLLWEILFTLGMIAFLYMFIIFSIKGYKEIIQLIKKNDD